MRFSIVNVQVNMRQLETRTADSTRIISPNWMLRHRKNMQVNMRKWQLLMSFTFIAAVAVAHQLIIIFGRKREHGDYVMLRERKRFFFSLDTI